MVLDSNISILISNITLFPSYSRMPHLYHVDVGAITTFQLENTIQVNIQDEFTTGTEMFSEIFNCVLNDAYKNGDFTSTKVNFQGI